ncbi:MAG TPA: phosphate ABC transporter substrate-binding protein PstS [Tetragenococcus sp.]|nr:phosphate ABC transporter substrate-binding protein PstS [Tetragenococcus sp.]
MKKKVFSLIILLPIFFTLTACSRWIDHGESITAVGSSALQPLVETAAEAFQTENPGRFVNVQGGGSGTGLSQVQAGAVDIGNSDMFAQEKSGIDAKKLVGHKVAVVGITPIVNKKVGVEDISKEDLKKIFLGQITNWKELGGADHKIVLLNRASGSGTRNTFEKEILAGQTAIQAQEQDSSGMVRQIVSETPGAISYVAFSYVTDEVAVLSIDGIKASDENVTTDKWPIWSYEHMYTKGQPSGLTKDFIDFIMSDEIQKEMIAKLGYIPITQMQVSKDAKGNIIK